MEFEREFGAPFALAAGEKVEDSGALEVILPSDFFVFLICPQSVLMDGPRMVWGKDQRGRKSALLPPLLPTRMACCDKKFSVTGCVYAEQAEVFRLVRAKLPGRQGGGARRTCWIQKGFSSKIEPCRRWCGCRAGGQQGGRKHPPSLSCHRHPRCGHCIW